MISISDFSNSGSFTLKEFEQIDLKPTPLIFALTGVMSTQMTDALKANFSRVYDRIGVAESKKIV